MKHILIALAILFTISCSKSNDNSRDGFGCAYGVSNVTHAKVYIKCMHHDIYICGSNQSAADKTADRLGLPHEDVSFWNNYTQWSFVANSKCDCQ
jgi:hypothetical protein